MNKALKITNLIVGLSLILLFATGCSGSSNASATGKPKENPTTAVITEPAEAASETADVNADTPAGISIDGRYDGSLTVAGSSLATIITFSTVDGILKASLDIPAQKVSGYELANVIFDGSRVSFEGFEETGRKAVWDGSLQEDGKISGSFNQAGITGTFELLPTDQGASAEEALPYKEEEISVTNEDITLGGTLSIPQGEGPFPVVVMISGSGSQDRNEDVFGFKMFAIIADQLARNGIAVVRYDDRGIGDSTGNLADSTNSELAKDVLVWIEYLKTRGEINPQKIGLMGHSEGGIIAPMVAAESDDIAFIVLMAGPAMKGEETIYKQIEAISRAGGVSEEEIASVLEKQHRIFDGLIRGQDWEGAKTEIRQQITDQVNALPDAQKQGLGDLDQYIETVYQKQISTLESKWYRNFLEYDPAPVLEKTTIPVLALFGGLDVQVPAEPNSDLMKAALEKAGNTDATITIYPKANHLFQEAVTGNIGEYAALKPEFMPGFLTELTNWILDKTSDEK